MGTYLAQAALEQLDRAQAELAVIEIDVDDEQVILGEPWDQIFRAAAHVRRVRLADPSRPSASGAVPVRSVFGVRYGSNAERCTLARVSTLR